MTGGDEHRVDGEVGQKNGDKLKLNMTIGHYKGNVVIDFGEQITWMSIPPDEARKFGEMIIEHADKAVEEKPG